MTAFDKIKVKTAIENSLLFSLYFGFVTKVSRDRTRKKRIGND